MPEVYEPDGAAGDHRRAAAGEPRHHRTNGANVRVRDEGWAGVLRMNEPVVIQIIGAPVACAEGVKDTWREVAMWAAGQLQEHFGDAVRVDYYDLFDSTCPALPIGVQLPLVLVNGEVLSSGGKIAIPTIRRRVEVLGLSASQ
jgi:hypothetical protein